MKISSKSNIRNQFKTLPVLQVPSSLSSLPPLSKSLPGFMEDMEVLKNLEMVSYDIHKPSEVAVKISSKSNIRNPTCPPSPFLESFRTWRFLTNLELVSNQWEHPYDLSVRVSSSTHISKTSTQHIQN